MKNLTPSQAHYIKAVYELSFNSGDRSVRIVDIAEKLDVSKASASIAMSKLADEKLVIKDERRQVFLTQEGERHVISIMDKCKIIQGFLTDILDVNIETAKLDTCAIEHVVSLDTLCAMCCFIHRANTNKQCNKECNKDCHVMTEKSPADSI